MEHPKFDDHQPTINTKCEIKQMLKQCELKKEGKLPDTNIIAKVTEGIQNLKTNIKKIVVEEARQEKKN